MTTQPRSLDESVQVSRRPNRGRAWLASVAIVGLAALVLGGWWWNSLRPENCYRRGRGALAAGDRMTVIREARRLIGNPGFEAQGRLLSGRLLLHDQRPADALPELQFAAHEPATAVDALTAAAECHYLLGQYLRAIEAGRAALGRDSGALDARRWLAAAYYDLGAIPYATQELEAISAAAPSDPRPDRLLGLMCKDNQKFTEAMEHYRESLRRDPHQADRQAILMELAEALISLVRFEEAREMLRECDRTPRALALAATCEQRLGRPDEAYDLLRDALALDPEYLPAKLHLGPLLLERGRPDEAVAILEDAVRGAPYSSEAHFHLSQAYAGRGKRNQADEQLRLMKEAKAVEREFNDLHEAAAKKPNDADVRYRIGMVARQLGKPDLARLWFRAALAIEPGHSGTRAALSEDGPLAP